MNRLGSKFGESDRWHKIGSDYDFNPANFTKT
jgi:hypothetical protein